MTDALLRLGEWVARLLGGVLGRTAFMKRRRGRAALSKLGTGIQRRLFDEALGGLPISSERSGAYASHLYRSSLWYVQAVSNHTDEVVAYAVTTRSRHFNPTFETAPSPNHPRVAVTLCRTYYSDIDFDPDRALGLVGARRFGYSEYFYFGNPGHYRSFAFTTNDAGPRPGVAWVDVDYEGDEPFEPTAEHKTFRENASPNTYAVTAPHVGFDDLPFGVGPDLDHVRTIP